MPATQPSNPQPSTTRGCSLTEESCSGARFVQVLQLCDARDFVKCSHSAGPPASASRSSLINLEAQARGDEAPRQAWPWLRAAKAGQRRPPARPPPARATAAAATAAAALPQARALQRSAALGGRRRAAGGREGGTRQGGAEHTGSGEQGGQPQRHPHSLDARVTRTGPRDSPARTRMRDSEDPGQPAGPDSDGLGVDSDSDGLRHAPSSHDSDVTRRVRPLQVPTRDGSESDSGLPT